jgi:hypothetical protein
MTIHILSRYAYESDKKGSRQVLKTLVAAKNIDLNQHVQNGSPAPRWKIADSRIRTHRKLESPTAKKRARNACVPSKIAFILSKKKRKRVLRGTFNGEFHVWHSEFDCTVEVLPLANMALAKRTGGGGRWRRSAKRTSSRARGALKKDKEEDKKRWVFFVIASQPLSAQKNAFVG